MKDHIILSVPKGSQIFKGDGSVVTLNEVPGNAPELIENGATWLMFKRSAVDKLSRLSLERLQNLLKLRQDQNQLHDVEVLREALELKNSKKPS